MFEPPEALPINTLSKLHYLIHELYLTSHLSFPELLHCGTHCHPLLSLNPTICHLLNLTSTNLILSPFLLKLPLIFSFCPMSRLCYRPYGLSPALLTKEKCMRACVQCQQGMGIDVGKLVLNNDSKQHNPLKNARTVRVQRIR